MICRFRACGIVTRARPAAAAGALPGVTSFLIAFVVALADGDG